MIDFSSVNNILALVFTIIVFGLVDFFLYPVIKRWFPRVYLWAFEIVIILSWIFRLSILLTISVCLWGVGLIFFLFSNLSETRFLVANTLKGQVNFALFKKTNKVKPEPIFDREEMYKKVEAAVLTLSRQKIGALMTFERHDDLSEVMKNGTIINAPVTSELLQTIFYPGTRLHDGAVVIRNDKIVAASVYFTPTNRPLTGKFGSRHRAAYGISETTDSVTVVVSEETGRISIAFQGELTPVTPDNFLRIFEEDMAYSNETKAVDDTKKDS
jgi:diadenylate cyclase